MWEQSGRRRRWRYDDPREWPPQASTGIPALAPVIAAQAGIHCPAIGPALSPNQGTTAGGAGCKCCL